MNNEIAMGSLVSKVDQPKVFGTVVEEIESDVWLVKWNIGTKTRIHRKGVELCKIPDQVLFPYCGMILDREMPIELIEKFNNLEVGQGAGVNPTHSDVNHFGNGNKFYRRCKGIYREKEVEIWQRIV